MTGSLARIPPEDEWRVGAKLLRSGDYLTGWRLWERRPIRKPRLSFPEWDGRNIGSLLIVPEQGLGDQIMFARYVPILRSKGIEPHLMCDPKLAQLFSHLDVPILPTVGTFPAPKVDAWIMAPSLPYVLGTTADTVPPPVYLPGGPGGSNVGVMTSGNPSHVNDANRSLPSDLATELRKLGVSLAPEDTGAADFEATREIVAGLSLIITVDTAVAHLAGAMGKPCWVLLPYANLDWRWADGVQSPWYPEMRLFRQPTPGDWTSALASVCSAYSNHDQ